MEGIALKIKFNYSGTTSYADRNDITAVIIYVSLLILLYLSISISYPQVYMWPGIELMRGASKQSLAGSLS